MTTKLEGIAAKARLDKEMRFTSLAHHITQDRLLANLNKIASSTSQGIDNQSVTEAKETFATWAKEMIIALHRRGYKPSPARRVYIPKPGKQHEMRPIAVPTVSDRTLQKTVAEVLNAIYEQDFLTSSFGGRPNKNSHQAVATLKVAIDRKRVNYIYEADIENFFGSLEHGWVERLISHRVGDPRIMSLIHRWLKAGVMTDGKHQWTEKGTVQGGPISVLISNIYLHYVLDLWIKKVVKPRLKGEVYYVRYIDDFVLGFEYHEDVIRFQEALSKRLNKFSLALQHDKTRLLEFGRTAQRKAERKGEKMQTFSFLGFTFYNSKTRKGRYKVGIKTEKKRLNRSCANMKAILRMHRHDSIREQSKRINEILSGHYQYYGLPGNWEALDKFQYFTVRYWRKVLSSRSQNGKVTWDRYNHILKIFPLRQPKLRMTYAQLSELGSAVIQG